MLDPSAVLNAISHWLERYPTAELIWGGGLEAQPSLLEQISRLCPVRGSALEAVRVLHDRAALRAACMALGISQPAESTTPGVGQWLRKRAGRAGGWHVSAWDDEMRAEDSADDYYQRWTPGRCGSITLLVGATHSAVLGFNRLLTRGNHFKRDYRYLGAVGRLELTHSVRVECARLARALAQHLGWRGLCGMDFIVQADESFTFIDFNPRPVASAELHASLGPAFASHLAACRGAWIPLPRWPGVRAHCLVEAEGPIQIPNSLDWPDWVFDRPNPGQHFSAGEPVCTVHAADSTEARCLALLERRVGQLRARLSTLHNITSHSGSIHAD